MHGPDEAQQAELDRAGPGNIPGQERVVERVLRAVGHNDLPGRVFQFVFLQKLFADSRAQLHRAGGGRVFGHALCHGLGGGGDDVRGRVEIGLADAEIDDVMAFGLQRFGLGRDGKRGAFLHGQSPLRQFHNVTSL